MASARWIAVGLCVGAVALVTPSAMGVGAYAGREVTTSSPVRALTVDDAQAIRPDSAMQLAQAMMADPSIVTSARFVHLPDEGRSVAIGHAAARGFPTRGGSYGVLSTGDAFGVYDAETDFHSQELDGEEPFSSSSVYDVTSLQIVVDPPGSANCMVGADFRFLSEEYPDYVNQTFNDAFLFEVGDSNWQATDASVVAPNNVAFDPVGKVISINGAGVTSMTSGQASGTTYGGATPLLNASTTAQGTVTLTLTVFDAGDSAYDSLVQVDNIRFGGVPDGEWHCRPGAIIDDGRRYVALGDSYSSGIDIYPFEDGTVAEADGVNNCWRSTRAYAPLLAKRFDLDLDFEACQGAVTRDVYDERWSEDEGRAWRRVPQLSHAERDTQLLTLSIGGNDAHFAEVVEECIKGVEFLPGNDCHGEDKVEEPLEAAFDRLANLAGGPAEIIPYEHLLKDLMAASPFATRVIVGYPAIFSPTYDERCEYVSGADQEWMYFKTRRLNRVIEEAARQSGFIFVDPEPYFEGRHLCEANDSFIGIGHPRDRNPGAFHPSAPGHVQIERAIADALRRSQDEQSRSVVKDGDTVESAVAVPAGTRALTLFAQWPGDHVAMQVHAPDGSTYGAGAGAAANATGGVVFETGETWSRARINEPMAGEWIVRLTASTPDPNGLPIALVPTLLEPPNDDPTATITYNRAPDGSLTFSAASSIDPDGTITQWRWFVSSAHASSETDGATLSLPAPARDTAVSLRVTDNDGGQGFAAVVVPASPTGDGERPVERRDGTVVGPVRDLVAPRLSAVRLERRVRGRSRVRWVPTTRLEGRVRLRLRTTEAAQMTITLRRRARPYTTVAFRRTVPAGDVIIPFSGRIRALGRGPIDLRVVAADPTKNQTALTRALRR